MTRASFASARAGLWQALLDRSGVTPTRGWSGDRVEARHADWVLVLDSYRVPIETFEHTRMVVALPELGLRFRVFEPDAFSWVGTLFGLLDIEIGDEEFDRAWVIKSSSAPRIRELLADEDLRNRISAIQHCALSLEADLGPVDPQRKDDERWDELVLARAELQTSIEGLRQMFELVANTLERLEALAPAWD
jgi:hypothetical protein